MVVVEEFYILGKSSHHYGKQIMQYKIISENAMTSLGREIADVLKPYDVITMKGDLGAGKTFLTRAIIRALCGEGTIVASPTFNILQIYNASDYDIYHYDLYRLKSADEIYELGIEDALNGNITIIEWPEIIENSLPKSRIEINIACDKNGDRVVRVLMG